MNRYGKLGAVVDAITPALHERDNATVHASILLSGDHAQLRAEALFESLAKALGITEFERSHSGSASYLTSEDLTVGWLEEDDV